MSLTAMTSGLVNVTCAGRIKIEDVGEEKEVLWYLRDKGVDLQNCVSQLASLIYVELGQDLLPFLKSCMEWFPLGS